ncbi:receptor-like protein eix2 [Quercus suber]|uniref:Receptor-like protein eix2 n=1 Tax=Quercus suber TaxID=58331 RepID=A0AAW0LE55_QUESU
MDLGKNRFSGKVPAWIGEGLPRLFSLSLHSNKFAGSIPLHFYTTCLNNFTGMTQEGISSVGIIKHFIPYSYYNCDGYNKGSEHTYSKFLQFIKIIDLSRNKLTGKLPSEILASGFKSSNDWSVGSLESLDLSWNKFQAKSHLHVNLTFLWPEPASTSTSTIAFAGNRHFVGSITPLCPGEETPNQSEPRKMNMVLYRNRIRSPIGFWGVCIALVFDRSWRHAYFLLLDRMKDWLYVTMKEGCIAVLKAKRLIHVKYVAATGCSRQISVTT